MLKWNILEHLLSDLMILYRWLNQRNLTWLFHRRNNYYGRIAKLGSNGKFYWGRRLEVKWTWWNGVCGPFQGWNCKAWMALDTKHRQLGPNFKINKNGITTLFHLETGKYYWEWRFPNEDSWIGKIDKFFCFLNFLFNIYTFVNILMLILCLTNFINFIDGPLICSKDSKYQWDACKVL